MFDYRKEVASQSYDFEEASENDFKCICGEETLLVRVSNPPHLCSTSRITEFLLETEISCPASRATSESQSLTRRRLVSF